jgi:hypothetical protein
MYLYPNPDKPRATEPIEVIMDTGAAMTMFPDTYPYAWHNLRLCHLQLLQKATNTLT